jgi:hypothetical protein
MTLIPSAPPLRPIGGVGAADPRVGPGSPETDRARLGRPADLPAPRTETAPDAASAAPATGVVSTPAPRGMDPALWSLLTTDERAHFARARELGPLTYGRASGPEVTPPPMRGIRLDVRV